MAESSQDLTHVFAPFDSHEIERLERFARKVDELSASSFAQEIPRMHATLIPGATVLGGPAWELSVHGAPEEAVKAVVGDFRQLFTDSNRSSAVSITKLLTDHAATCNSEASRLLIKQLRDFRKQLRARRTTDPYGKFLEEDPAGGTVERTPEDIIKTWLNGEYLHDDAALAADLPSGHAGTEMMRLTLHNAIGDYLRFWQRLRWLVGRVLADTRLRS